MAFRLSLYGGESEPRDTATTGLGRNDDDEERAMHALHSLELPSYEKSDRIYYEFEGYDLLFLSFRRR